MICGWNYVYLRSVSVTAVVYCAVGLTAGWNWPLMLAVRKGELVERRLSHSLGRGSGTDSMKLLFSSLMLVWWRMISVWVLSTSFDKNKRVTRGRQKGKNNSLSREKRVTENEKRCERKANSYIKKCDKQHRTNEPQREQMKLCHSSNKLTKSALICSVAVWFQKRRVWQVPMTSWGHGRIFSDKPDTRLHWEESLSFCSDPQSIFHSETSFMCVMITGMR